MHESVLNLNQLDALSCFFARMFYFSNQMGVASDKIRESDIDVATQTIYGNIGTQLEALSQKGTNFDLSRYQSLALMPSRHIFNRMSQAIYVGTGLGLTANQFTVKLKQHCKNRLIPGPLAFLKDTPFILEYNDIQADIFQTGAIETWPKFKESFENIPNCRIPRCPLPMQEYAAAIARACITGTKSTIGSNETQHQMAIMWLDKTANRQVYGSAANQHYLDFYTENNAAYFLESLVDSISDCLNHSNCSEAHVERILNLLGVSPSNIALLKTEIDGKQYFNRFQIKLFLLPMTLHAMCQKELLADIQTLSRERNPWVAIEIPGKPINYAHTPENWQSHGMAIWKNTQIQGIKWSLGGPPSTSQTRDLMSARLNQHGLYAGGSRADQRTVERQEEKQGASLGSCG